MKKDHSRFVKDKEDFYKFVNEAFGRTLTKEGANDYCLNNGLGFPSEYPCWAAWKINRYEVDDVGFGFESSTTLDYSYKKDFERQLEELKKKLKAFA